LLEGLSEGPLCAGGAEDKVLNEVCGATCASGLYGCPACDVQVEGHEGQGMVFEDNEVQTVRQF